MASRPTTTAQYPSPDHGRTQTRSPSDLPEPRAPAARSRRAIGVRPDVSATSSAVPRTRARRSGLAAFRARPGRSRGRRTGRPGEARSSRRRRHGRDRPLPADTATSAAASPRAAAAISGGWVSSAAPAASAAAATRPMPAAERATRLSQPRVMTTGLARAARAAAQGGSGRTARGHTRS